MINIRNIFPLSLLCCGITATLLLGSCMPETENVFGESAAIRMEKAVVNNTTILESNSQGWSMDFYPGERVMGGIAYTAQFKDGNVKLRCERAIDYSDLVYKSEYKYAAAEEVTSGYSVKSETGVVLTFDTFNALIHYWAQPFGLNASGYASDYEFTFIHASADSVVLRGKKYGNLMRLYPLKESPADHLAKTIAMRQQLSDIARQRLIVDGETQLISFSDNHLKYTDNGIDYDMPFTYTADGIRFYQSVSIKGIQFNQMTYDAATKDLRTADGRVVMPAPTVTEQFMATKTQWYFGFSKTGNHTDMCDDLVALMAPIINTFKDAKHGFGYEVLNDIYIGANLLSADKDTNRLVIGFHSRGSYGSGAHEYFGYGITMTAEAPERQLVNITPTEPGVGFDTRNFCKTLVDFVGDNSPYLLTFDDNSNPTVATLTSERDATKWFKLKKTTN